MSTFLDADFYKDRLTGYVVITLIVSVFTIMVIVGVWRCISLGGRWRSGRMSRSRWGNRRRIDVEVATGRVGWDEPEVFGGWNGE